MGEPASCEFHHENGKVSVFISHLVPLVRLQSCFRYSGSQVSMRTVAQRAPNSCMSPSVKKVYGEAILNINVQSGKRLFSKPWPQAVFAGVTELRKQAYVDRSINAPTTVSVPLTFFGRSFPSTCTTEHLGFACTKALLKTEGPRASQKGRSASSSPSTQHVKISAFQRSSAKERKRGKR